jgi:hypothetical protein
MHGIVKPADYSHRVGHRFAGGTTRVPRWMNALWADSVHVPDPTPYVHPVLVYYAAVEGAGVSFQDIFNLMDGSTESGILYGGQRLEFAAPIEVDHLYEVRGGVVDVVRKEGKRTGVFDLLVFEISLFEPGT